MNRFLREYSLTLALLVSTLAAAFFPVLFQGRTILPSDLIDTMMLPFARYFGPEHAYNSLITDAYFQFYPLKYFTQHAYHHGFFAFWNPYILNGYPQYLEGMWTYNVVLLLPFAFAFRCIVLLPLLVAGIGFYALMREYDVRPGVARIFATAYMLNALFVTHLLAHFIPASFSFAPFVLFFLHWYDRNPSFKFLAFAAVALALAFLAGNIQTIGFLVFLTACYWISLWFFQTPRSVARLFRPLGIVLGFAVGLTAIMLLPTLELVYETMKGGAFFSTSLLRSYDILQRIESVGLALTFFVPQLAGSVRGVLLHQAVGVFAVDFEGAIGFLPLFLAVWAGVALWKQRPEIRLFVILMIVGFVLPIATPLFRFLYHRFFIVFILGACGAGAIGFEAILSGTARNASLRNWANAFAIGLAAIIAVLSAFSFLRAFDFPLINNLGRMYLLPRLKSAVFAQGNAEWVHVRFLDAMDYWSIARPELLAGIVSSLLALALLRCKDRFRPDVLVVSVWIITTLQLILFVRLWFPMLDTHVYPLYPKTPETQLLADSSRNSRVYFYRETDAAKQFAFIDNENLLYGISEATGFVSVVPRCLYVDVVALRQKDTSLVTPAFLGKFNISTLARVKPLPFDSLTLVDSGALWIYKNPWVMPRAFLAHRAEIIPNDTDILERLSNPAASWPTAYFTPNEAASSLQTLSSIGDTVIILHTSENEMRMAARNSDSCYLILSDTYYPGWEAFVDGKETPILRCNYAMRAVLLPAGEHRVVFVFRPLSFRIGAWISGGTIVLLLGLVWFKRRKP